MMTSATMYVSVCGLCPGTQLNILQVRGAAINRNAKGKDFMAPKSVIRGAVSLRLSQSRMRTLTNTMNSHAASKAEHTTQEIHAGLLRVARFRANHPQAEDLSEPGRVRIIGGELAKFLVDLATEGMYPQRRRSRRPSRYPLCRLLCPL